MSDVESTNDSPETRTSDDRDAPDEPSTPVAGGEGSGPSVVLSLGSSYYADGRASADGYASDLAPTFLSAISASQVLLRDLFAEVGASRAASIEVHCDQWQLLYGNEVGEAQILRREEDAPGSGSGSRGNSGDDKASDKWVRGLVASRDSDHAQALAAFESEANEALEAGSPQRAAVAYRAAAAAAQSAGRADYSNRLLRLAGKSYMEIAEKAETIPQGVFMAYREGARCFIEAGNLPLAHRCLSRAIAIGETLGYTEAS
jgi:hypothetical protein